jgi:hypothetical protein
MRGGIGVEFRRSQLLMKALHESTQATFSALLMKYSITFLEPSLEILS